MFDNIGKKIKLLANVLCWVGIIAYVIAAIIVFSVDDDLIGIGFLLLIAGPFMSWISSFFMYGFGELIDKVSDIERNTRSNERKSITQNRIEEERVEKLERLRSHNLITEEEYQQAITKDIV